MALPVSANVQQATLACCASAYRLSRFAVVPEFLTACWVAILLMAAVCPMAGPDGKSKGLPVSFLSATCYRYQIDKQ